MKILIVDDREDNLYFLKTLLVGNGHEVNCCSNGSEALDILQKGGTDLVISDILMPVMDGFQLCRKLKGDERTSAIPVIFYTATYTGPKDEELAMKVGASRFVVKPCEPEELIRIVNEVIEESRQRIDVPATESGDDEVLKLYNERLVRKLEQKMFELEKEAAARKEAEKILAASEKRYRLLYNSIRDAILVTDTSRRITGWNPAFEAMFGFQVADISNQVTRMIYESDEGFNRIGDVLSGLEKPNNTLQQVNFRRSDGSVFPGETSVYCLRSDENTMLGYICLIRDVTERINAELARKSLEQQLQHSQKMESLGVLTGGIAHDFNNLLSVILGYSEITLSRDQTDQKQNEYIKEIHQAGLRASGLTRQLLAFSRKQILEMKPVDLNTVVEGFKSLLTRLIGEDIRLEVRLADFPLPVMADIGQIEQVLMNLAVNARDAMPAGGKLSIEISQVDFDEACARQVADLKAGSYAFIAVSDTGRGIDKETLSRIFEPFFTTKGLERGTGLGLATSYGIVKQHGGSIWAYSEPGTGARFHVYLPLNNEVAASSTEVSIEQPPAFAATVMVVEDDKAVLGLVCEVLSGSGYFVIESSNPVEAVERAAAYKGPIHVI
ncbi:MAG: response regulator, partial [Candidatus Riflebacteria bacterium]|nr:response regulator [Candidatus Riflebacteria bacterium]